MFKDIKQQKKEIREQYRTTRKNIDKSYSSDAAKLLINIFNQNLHCIKGKIIAAYVPIDGEINVTPLMHHLFNLGYKIAIPSKNRLLKFEKANVEVVPDTIITPVIAFDDHFNRLGFGGGWYDRIMKELQPLGKVFIGLAYEKQYCKDLPVEEHDQKLDLIITETCARYRDKQSKKG
jgi:5-formyltetrahydrofolate cyclo-ligase